MILQITICRIRKKLKDYTGSSDFIITVHDRIRKIGKEDMSGFYETGIEFEEDSAMVLLATCSYQERDGRFVVAGIACKSVQDP